MIRAFVVTLDLDAEDLATLRARLADDDIELQKESAGLWHMFKGSKQATFRRLGTAPNGDKVFVAVGPHALGNYLVAKLGARVEVLADAWKAAGKRAWLEANGVRSQSFGGVSYPVPPIMRAGLSVRDIGSNYEASDE